MKSDEYGFLVTKFNDLCEQVQEVCKTTAKMGQGLHDRIKELEEINAKKQTTKSP